MHLVVNYTPISRKLNFASAREKKNIFTSAILSNQKHQLPNNSLGAPLSFLFMGYAAIISSRSPVNSEMFSRGFDFRKTSRISRKLNPRKMVKSLCCLLMKVKNYILQSQIFIDANMYFNSICDRE